jgi:hypothetical protein
MVLPRLHLDEHVSAKRFKADSDLLEIDDGLNGLEELDLAGIWLLAFVAPQSGQSIPRGHLEATSVPWGHQ